MPHIRCACTVALHSQSWAAGGRSGVRVGQVAWGTHSPVSQPCYGDASGLAECKQTQMKAVLASNAKSSRPRYTPNLVCVLTMGPKADLLLFDLHSPGPFSFSGWRHAAMAVETHACQEHAHGALLTVLCAPPVQCIALLPVYGAFCRPGNAQAFAEQPEVLQSLHLAPIYELA